MEKIKAEKGPVPETKTFNRKQIFWAILPWAIIALAIVGGCGYVRGWMDRSGDQGRIQSEASALVQQLKVKE